MCGYISFDTLLCLSVSLYTSPFNSEIYYSAAPYLSLCNLSLCGYYSTLVFFFVYIFICFCFYMISMEPLYSRNLLLTLITYNKPPNLNKIKIINKDATRIPVGGMSGRVLSVSAPDRICTTFPQTIPTAPVLEPYVPLSWTPKWLSTPKNHNILL